MRNVVTALSLLWLAAPAQAHDTWLLPDRWQVAAGDRAVFALTSAMAFPEPETAVMPDRLEARNIRLAGKTATLDTEAGQRALKLSAVVSGTGVARAWIVSRPRSLTLTPEQVAHYLDEIGAQSTIGAQWKRSGQKVWRETYFKVAKTMVRVGEPGSDSSWAEPLGLDLEIVPESDPTRIKQGDALSVRLLWQGKPLPDLAVGATATSPAKPVLVRTDAGGRATFELDRSGAWLLRATLIRPSDARKGEWESVFTTLTLNVAER